MASQPAVEDQLERLLGIDWRPNDERLKSQVALVREYLRRAALWADRLQMAEEWPFFDVALQIDPSIRADPEYVTTLRARLTGIPLHPKVKATSEWSLHWAALKAASRTAQFDLPDPYEPLLRMYERGGSFYTEHGFIVIGPASVWKGDWRDHLRPEPVTNLDEDALNARDAT